MNLLIEYYTPENSERNFEYLKCIQANITNAIIETITIFLTDDTSVLPETISSHPKVNIVKLEFRPYYSYFFKYCNDNFVDQVCVVSNTDIIFDSTLSFLSEHNFNKDFFALTRWDMFKLQVGSEKYGLRFFNVNMSQDAWVFKTPINIEGCDFGLGILGCDNVIAYKAYESGYNVKNPSKKVVISHLHLSNFRTYTPTNILPPPYLFLEPNDSISGDTIKVIYL